MATQTSHLTTNLQSPTHPLHLRPLHPSDAPLLAALLSSPQNTSQDPHAKTAPMTPETATAVIQKMTASAAEPTVLDPQTGRPATGPARVNLAVVYSDPAAGGEGDRLVGLGGYGCIHTREGGVRAGDVGVMIDGGYRGRGFAVEAMRLAIEWGLRAVGEGGLQLDLVTIATLEENEAMVGIVERKFGLEGVRRECKEKGMEGKVEVFWEFDAEGWRGRGKGKA